MDLIYLGMVVGLFALAFGLVRACQSLMAGTEEKR